MTFQSPVRIAQMSDLHYCGKNLAESERCFSYAVDRAIDEKVDGVVVSGDSTDHALDVHAPAFVALARNIRRLADHCPVLMLQGTFSHEPPGTLSVFRLLGGHYPVWVADRLQQVALMPGGTWVGSEGWRFDEMPDGARTTHFMHPDGQQGQCGGRRRRDPGGRGDRAKKCRRCSPAWRPGT